MERLPEITVRVVILSIILAAVLAVANAYLALKIGILTSASIPAAIISMGILRFFKNSSILENNQVQTAASAGEAVAGGIVYTIPALIIINYWSHFSYWENFLIALLGGLLGVLFSIPIRHNLMNDQNLRFPEGRAIAELLKIGNERIIGLKEILLGGCVGALIEFAQTGLKVIASDVQYWFERSGVLFGFGGGFSATMIGAGYLIGFNLGLSIFIGAIVGWLFCVPLLSSIYGITVHTADTTQMVMHFWGEKIRYVGIGAMLVAGIWTLLKLLRPLFENLAFSKYSLADTESKDIPGHYILLGISLLAVSLYFFLGHILPLNALGFSTVSVPFLISSIFYILIMGFIFTTICAYFSGMVGVSATPGSSIIIAGMLIVALLIRILLSMQGADGLLPDKLLNAAAATIIIGAIVAGAACIANDNTQDLKVGNIIGATPWKQQIMLILGVTVSAAVIPPIMELLYNVYGIANSLPHSGMNPTQTLPAPPAALMAAVTQAVFKHQLPWKMVWFGVFIISIGIILNYFLTKQGKKLSILGVAIGIYLPLGSSIPLFLGALIALLTGRVANQQPQRGVMIACGLVAGSALMDVLLAIPFSFYRNPDVLAIMPAQLMPLTIVLGVLSVLGLGIWINRSVKIPQ